MTDWIGRIVAVSGRHPLIVLLLSLMLTALSVVHFTNHFAMTTDVTELISTEQDWRQRELAYSTAFPSL